MCEREQVFKGGFYGIFCVEKRERKGLFGIQLMGRKNDTQRKIFFGGIGYITTV